MASMTVWKLIAWCPFCFVPIGQTVSLKSRILRDFLCQVVCGYVQAWRDNRAQYVTMTAPPPLADSSH